MQMSRGDGELVTRAVLDAIGLATERIEEPQLLAVIVHLVIEDADDDIRVVTQTWPQKD